MIFLNFVTDWLSKTADGIMGTILHGVRTLFYSLDTMVYKLIISAYNVFRMLCRGRLLDDSMLSEIATRVGLILGIIMFLTICFSMIQIILEPDKLTDKEMGAPAIIKKVIITIIMLGSSSFVFSSLYNIQNYIIDSDIISKLLLPATISNDPKNGANGRDKFGNILSMELLMTFYRIDDLEPDPNDADAANTLSMCETTITALQNQIYNTERFDLGYNCLNETIQIAPANSVTGKQDSYVIDFNWLFSLLCGCVVLYLMVMYCFSIGIRIIQLAVLEIMSPMAIISYVSPKKDNMFSKWIKIYISTYIDVFIRIAIIDFVVLLLAAFFNSGGLDGIELWNSIGANSSTSFGTKSFITVVMIIALLFFAKKAPDLIKDLLPASASKIGFGIQSPKQFFEDINKSPLTQFGKTVGAPVGLLAKKTVGGIDAKMHGHTFSSGWERNKGKFSTWIDKQRETYMPYSFEQRKERAEGRKEVETINTKWETGVKIAKKLMKERNLGKAGTGENGWDKALNGKNRANYETIFKSSEFINSKMAVDKESEEEDKLRRAYQQVQAGGSFSYTDTKTGITTTYSVANNNVDGLLEIYEKQTKKVEGLKANHESIRKQNQTDAAIEDAFKYIKNNESNPSNPQSNRTNRDI